MNPTMLIAIGAVVVVLVLIIAVISIRSQRSSVVEERLERIAEPGAFMKIAEEEEKEKEKKPSALTQRLEDSLKSRNFAKNWRDQLARADLKLTVSEYLALHVIAMFGVAFLCYFILFPGQIVFLILGAGVGLFIPRIYVSFKQSRRLHAFEQQLPDILGLWVNSLRSGYSVMQALEAISREAPNPAAAEIKRVVTEVQLGIPMEEALANLLRRMPSDDLDLIITAVNIQREVGGNLAEILEVIGHTIRERIKLKGEVRVLTAQGRVTGYLISGLPIVLALFLFMVNREYMGRMFEDRLCGWPMIGIGLGMIGIGTAIIQKIVDIEL
ncbi:MAG: type II secretion system F family protein [Anaerolineae bacterium]|nr:type II secretion system F family protein [Anaerolineae bacterium]